VFSVDHATGLAKKTRRVNIAVKGDNNEGDGKVHVTDEVDENGGAAASASGQGPDDTDAVAAGAGGGDEGDVTNPLLASDQSPTAHVKKTVSFAVGGAADGPAAKGAKGKPGAAAATARAQAEAAARARVDAADSRIEKVDLGMFHRKGSHSGVAAGAVVPTSSSSAVGEYGGDGKGRSRQGSLGAGLWPFRRPSSVLAVGGGDEGEDGEGTRLIPLSPEHRARLYHGQSGSAFSVYEDDDEYEEEEEDGEAGERDEHRARTRAAPLLERHYQEGDEQFLYETEAGKLTDSTMDAVTLPDGQVHTALPCPAMPVVLPCPLLCTATTPLPLVSLAPNTQHPPTHHTHPSPSFVSVAVCALVT